MIAPEVFQNLVHFFVHRFRGLAVDNLSSNTPSRGAKKFFG
jgi:hypothetical protein